jgi:hypothetical protein
LKIARNEEELQEILEKFSELLFSHVENNQQLAVLKVVLSVAPRVKTIIYFLGLSGR